MSCGFVMIGTIFGNISLAALIVFLLATLVYMLGKLFSKQEYIAYAKTEFYNFFVTMVLVLSFVSVAGIASQLSCGPNNEDLFELATSKMSNLIYGVIYPTLRNLFEIMLESSLLSNFTITFAKGAITFNPGAGFRYFYTSISVISYILEAVFASLYIQSFLLIVIKHTAFSILFPIGIFLRAFPITRDAGTYMMALTFSLYVVFPYMYVVSLDAYDQIMNNNNYQEFSESLYHHQSAWLTYSEYIEDAMFYLISAASYSSIKEMFFEIGSYMLISVSIPALAIILTVALTTSIMKFLKEVTS